MRSRHLAFSLAWRYLTAPKSHGAVNAISIISIVGVAVASAAIIIVLSVFNGFMTHLNFRLDTLTADVSVTPALGKTFENGDSLARAIAGLPGVMIAMPMVTDNALAIAGSKEMPVTLRGVSTDIYPYLTSIDSLLLVGNPVRDFLPKEAMVSVGVAQRLGIYDLGEEMLIFAPKRSGRINTANPFSSFLTDSLSVASVFRSMQTEYDENTVICDINVVRDLFQYDTQASSIEIKSMPDTDPEELASQIAGFLGEGFVVKDRLRQQEMNFRMVSIEKWITFLLLVFILVIASFNIISALCMLIIEKENSLKTLSDLGLSRKKIGNVFGWESLIVTFLGTLAGLLVGVILCLVQEKFGLIRLSGDPDTLVLQSYPVKVEWIDLGVTFLPVLIIGLITARIASSFAKRTLIRQA